MLVLLGLRAGRGWERSFSMGLIVLGVLLACGPSFTFGQNSASISASNPDRLPVTTTSPEAAKLFEEGLHLRYDYHLERALVKWREAAIKDPNFAQAWTYIVSGRDQGGNRAGRGCVGEGNSRRKVANEMDGIDERWPLSRRHCSDERSDGDVSAR